MAEREAVSRFRFAVLGALVDRLKTSRRALPYARALTSRRSLVRSGACLGRAPAARVGRNREAHSHYERAWRMFEAELGAPPSEALLEARKALQRVTDTRAVALPRNRQAARSAICRSSLTPSDEQANMPGSEPLNDGRKGRASERPVVTGEAGIGKSHLLDAIARA